MTAVLANISLQNAVPYVFALSHFDKKLKQSLSHMCERLHKLSYCFATKCPTFGQFSCSDIADANAYGAVSDSASVFASLLPVALLQTNLLRVCHFGHESASVALVFMLRTG